MGITLRPHQLTAIADINRKFNEGHKHILSVLPTGAGKSLTLADYAKRSYLKNEICIIFAHRDVLISQLSEALCKMHVPHSFICSNKARKDITNNNLQLFGDSYFDDKSTVIVSSNPTFSARIKRQIISDQFLNSVVLWLQDEGHHTIMENQWHRCIEPMVNAKGIGFTATPLRGDRKGLGSHADGVYDALSSTSSMIDLINKEMLTAYKIFATGQIDINGIKKDKNGELNRKQLRIKTKEADITGDAVEQYLKHLNGKPVITFCINIEHANEVADDFNANGIKSIAISSKSTLHDRQLAMEGMRDGTIMNLVNVDLLGEGYDCPSVAGVIMLRRTTSYSLFKQQFGRMLRPSDGKVYGILLDHVGNTQYMMNTYHLEHPHDDPEWTLDRLIDKRKRDDDDDDEEYETMSCSKCGFFGLVEDFTDDTCPECGHRETEDEKVSRIREIKVQAGQLVELDLGVIDDLISQREDSYQPVSDFAANLSNNFHAKNAAVNRHAARQSSLNVLRHWIQEWSMKKWEDTDRSVKLIPVDFELEFKINILRAQVLPEPQMNKLTSKIQQSMRG